MTWDDELTLLQEVVTQNEWLEEVTTIEKEEVWCNEKDVRQSEFYAAINSDLKLSKMFEVKPYEYDNQTHVLFDDVVYTVKRTFKRDNEHLELICVEEMGWADWSNKYE